MDLTNDQKEKVLDVVDNSDAFMREVLGYLERSNSKLDREEAYYKVKDSVYKFLLNDEEIWSNMKLNASGGEKFGEEAVTIETIKTNDGQYFLKYQMFNLDGSLYTGRAYYTTEDNHIEGYIINEDGDKTLSSVDYFNSMFRSYDFLNQFGLNESHILSSEVLDNGNIKTTFLSQITDTFDENVGSETMSYFVTVEILPNGFLDKITINIGMTYGEYGRSDAYPICPITYAYDFEYGTLDREQMNNLYYETKDFVAGK